MVGEKPRLLLWNDQQRPSREHTGLLSSIGVTWRNNRVKTQSFLDGLADSSLYFNDEITWLLVSYAILYTLMWRSFFQQSRSILSSEWSHFTPAYGSKSQRLQHAPHSRLHLSFPFLSTKSHYSSNTHSCTAYGALENIQAIDQKETRDEKMTTTERKDEYQINNQHNKTYTIAFDPKKKPTLCVVRTKHHRVTNTGSFQKISYTISNSYMFNPLHTSRKTISESSFILPSTLPTLIRGERDPQYKNNAMHSNNDNLM